MLMRALRKLDTDGALNLEERQALQDNEGTRRGEVSAAIAARPEPLPPPPPDLWGEPRIVPDAQLNIAGPLT